MKPLLNWLLVAACMAGGGVSAQNGTIPDVCASKTGDALRACMQDVTPAEEIEQLTPVERTPDPAQLIDCRQASAADLKFCIGRNEVIVACRDKSKHPDFNACFAKYAPNIPAPTAENCKRSDTKSRAQCRRRNASYSKCALDPLRYFTCLANGGAPK